MRFLSVILEKKTRYLKLFMIMPILPTTIHNLTNYGEFISNVKVYNHPTIDYGKVIHTYMYLYYKRYTQVCYLVDNCKCI